jgi:hypothetical protein
MLSPEQFETVYRLLDDGMTSSDCGGPCARFCCTGAAVKALLPGEEALFTARHPDVELVHELWYAKVVQSECCCLRPYRMFACRAFPFRPVLDAASGEVADLERVDNTAFAACWVTEPQPDWRGRAIQAWKIVLGDPDNRRFYGRIAYLASFLDFLGARAEAMPEAELRKWMALALEQMTPEQEQFLYRTHFGLRSG